MGKVSDEDIQEIGYYFWNSGVKDAKWEVTSNENHRSASESVEDVKHRDQNSGIRI